MDDVAFKVLGLIILLALLVLLVIYGPQITIWAINLLFGLAIPITFKTWFACLWVQGIVYGPTYLMVKAMD